MSPAEINHLLPVWMTLLAGAFLGASLGSFLGCAAYRIPHRISMNARSFCPGCGKPVPGYFNIPVLAFLLLRGKSFCCKQPLSPGYLIFEVSTLIIGALVAWMIGVVWMLAALLIILFGVWGFAQARAQQPIPEEPLAP